MLIWVLRLDDAITPTARLLDLHERARADRMRTDAARRDFVAGRALAKTALGELTGTAPTDWSLVDGEGGRPTARGPGAADVNISHSGGLIAVVAAHRSESPVGIDVEDSARQISLDRLARRYFTPSEVEAYDALADPERRRQRFFSLWSLKEAHAKATGIGLARTISEVAFSLAADETGPIGSDPAWSWFLSRIGRHTLAVAAPAGTSWPPVTMIDHAAIVDREG